MRVDDCIVRNELLPSEEHLRSWEAIVVAPQIKDRLTSHALLALRLRGALPFSTTSLHGLLLLHGPPGTGKTTLARGLAAAITPYVGGKRTRLIEVNPHGLMSAEHGQSQQKVFELMSEHVPMLADDRLPTIVVLDEVESMAVARSEASLSANPADVHRATDAVLTSLDRNAQDHPHLLTVATSNFTGALDAAFVSRTDLALEVPLPDLAGATAILERVLGDFGVAYPGIARLASGPGLRAVAADLVGLDGRRIRKVVTEALAMRRETVLDPNALTLDDLRRAGGQMRTDAREGERAAA